MLRAIAIETVPITEGNSHGLEVDWTDGILDLIIRFYSAADRFVEVTYYVDGFVERERMPEITRAVQVIHIDL